MTSTGRRGPVTFADVQTQHMGCLLNVAMRHLRRDVTELAEANGMAQRYMPTLRTSHLRLLSLIPADGARITDLIYVADLPKQGIAQFMDHLGEAVYQRRESGPLATGARMR